MVAKNWSLVIGLAFAAVVSKQAAARCEPVAGQVVTQFVPCQVGIVCTEGTLEGSGLSGTTSFIATTLRPRGATLHFGGLFTVTEPGGTLTFETTGVLNAVTGRFTQTFTPIEGTGTLEGATGQLVSVGVSTFSGFSGDVHGAICRQ